MRLPLVSRCFCRSIRLRGRWNIRRPRSSYQRVVQGKCPLRKVFKGENFWETLQFPNAVVLNSVARRMSAKERKWAQTQEAAQYLPRGCSRKMPPSFPSFRWGSLLEHSFLEHFCLDQFSVILGKFYMQYSRTPRLVEHFWAPILGASCSNKLLSALCGLPRIAPI